MESTSTKPMFDQARLDGWGSYVAGMTSVLKRRPRPGLQRDSGLT